METLYDERKMREVPQTWVREDGKYEGVDMFYLRVRLFKAEVTVRKDVLGVDRVPLYFLLEEYESFEGDPENARGPSKRTKKRTYTRGPDSQRIRQAVALCDSFEGRRAYDSR